MTYFSLRKRHSETEPVEADDEHVETEAPDEQARAAPRGAAGALWAGVSGPGRWLTDRGRPGLAWLLYAGSAWAIGFYGGWATVGLVASWLAAVLVFMPREFKDRVTARVEAWNKPRTTAPGKPSSDTEESTPTDPHRALVGWLDELTRDRSGIHLDELHHALTRHPQLAGLKRAEMRVWLHRHHITVDRTLRVGKLAGRSGVSRGMVEALLKGLPPLPESDAADSPVHASDQCDSPAESGLERGGERAV